MKPYNLAIATAQPMNVGFQCPANQLYQAFAYTIQAVFDGTTISGSFYLEGTADPIDNTPADQLNPKVTNWTILENSTQVVVTAASLIWEREAFGTNYVRLVYADSSGGTSDGICNARINVKSF